MHLGIPEKGSGRLGHVLKKKRGRRHELETLGKGTGKKMRSPIDTGMKI
jgi:hypothetical protein